MGKKGAHKLKSQFSSTVKMLEKMAEHLGQKIEVVKLKPSKKPKKKPAPKPKPKQPENLYDDFAKASTVLGQGILESGKDGDTSKAHLHVSTPGIGKTEGGLHRAAIEAQSGVLTLYAIPTRNMAWQLMDRIQAGFINPDIPVIFLQGRHEGYVRRRVNEDGESKEIIVQPNCYRYAEVTAARAKGYPIQRCVCSKCPFCPYYKDKNGQKTGFSGACVYFKDLWRAAGIVSTGAPPGVKPIIITTHAMAANILTGSELVKPGIVIIDEDPIDALREVCCWTESELYREVDQVELLAFRFLLRRAIEIARFAHHQAASPLAGHVKADTIQAHVKMRKAVSESTAFNTISLWGKNLARLLYLAGASMDVDPELILQAASVADPGVENGEFQHMTVKRYNRLPHHKEPELAAELLQIYRMARDEDKEVAPKVTLRWDSVIGWQFVWDYVRRLQYGGILLLLDAYGEPKIVARYTQREVVLHEVYCKARSNVMVHIFPNVKTTRSVLDDEEYRDYLLHAYLAPILWEQWGKKILFYTQKRYEEWLREKLKKEGLLFKALEVKYFYQDRGDDSYGDFDVVVGFGTPRPNVVGERHAQNALFAGEEPLSWDVGHGFVPKDERVRVAAESRQQKELLQAIFRVRPSKPRETTQHIVLFTDMHIEPEKHLPGAEIRTHSKPGINFENFLQSMTLMYEEFGCWTDALAGLMMREELIIGWYRGGGLDGTAAFPLTYDEMQRRAAVLLETEHYFAMTKLFEVSLRKECMTLDWRGVPIRAWGDRAKAQALLDMLYEATREPGMDDAPFESQKKAVGDDVEPWGVEAEAQAYKLIPSHEHDLPALPPASDTQVEPGVGHASPADPEETPEPEAQAPPNVEALDNVIYLPLVKWIGLEDAPDDLQAQEEWEEWKAGEEGEPPDEGDEG